MIASIILGAGLAVIFTILFRVLNFGERSATLAIIATAVVSFLWGNKIKAAVGLEDDEIVLTENIRPMKVYDKMEVSGFKLDSISTGESILGAKTYIIGYSVTIKNNGDPIITIDDPSGNRPVEFNEDLVLRNLDGVEGKDDYTNFGEHENSALYDNAGKKIEFSAQNPIKTNDSFLCKGRLALEKEDIKNLVSRKHEAYLYLNFTGTTNDKYTEPNGFGFIIKQKEYKVDLSKFIAKYPEIIKDAL